MRGSLPVFALVGDPGESFQENFDAVKGMIETTGRFLTWPILIGISFFVLMFVACIVFNVLLIRRARKNNRSTRTTFVPPATGPVRCRSCGETLRPGSRFCGRCGAEQAPGHPAPPAGTGMGDGMHLAAPGGQEEPASRRPSRGGTQAQTCTRTFLRQGMENEAFLAMINDWLAQNDRIVNVSCEMSASVGASLPVNRYSLDRVTLEYECFPARNKNQYAMVELSRYGFHHTTTRELLDEWKSHNPEARVVETAGGTTRRGRAGSELVNGLGAQNNAQLFVFFQVPRRPKQG